MKKLVLLVILMLVVAGVAQAADWLELQYTQEPGHESFYKMTMDMDAKILAMGTELPPMKLQMVHDDLRSEAGQADDQQPGAADSAEGH
jgi:hypothetical protein